MIYPPDDLTLNASIRRRIRAIEGYGSDFIEMVKRSSSESGKSQLRDVWNRTKFTATPAHDGAVSDIEYLMQFWRTARTSTFTYFDFDKSRWTDENIGTGTGALATFTVPAKEMVEVVVKVNGVVKTLTTHYTISSETGSQGEDQIVFTGGNLPPNGQAVTISYLGRHRYTCEFAGSPKKESFGNNRASVQFAVQEVFV